MTMFLRAVEDGRCKAGFDGAHRAVEDGSGSARLGLPMTMPFAPSKTAVVCLRGPQEARHRGRRRP